MDTLQIDHRKLNELVNTRRFEKLTGTEWRHVILSILDIEYTTNFLRSTERVNFTYLLSMGSKHMDPPSLLTFLETEVPVRAKKVLADTLTAWVAETDKNSFEASSAEAVLQNREMLHHLLVLSLDIGCAVDGDIAHTIAMNRNHESPVRGSAALNLVNRGFRSCISDQEWDVLENEILYCAHLAPAVISYYIELQLTPIAALQMLDKLSGRSLKELSDIGLEEYVLCILQSLKERGYEPRELTGIFKNFSEILVYFLVPIFEKFGHEDLLKFLPRQKKVKTSA